MPVVSSGGRRPGGRRALFTAVSSLMRATRLRDGHELSEPGTREIYADMFRLAAMEHFLPGDHYPAAS